jgi:endoglucanase
MPTLPPRPRLLALVCALGAAASGACLTPPAAAPAETSAGAAAAAPPRRHNGASGGTRVLTVAPASTHNLILKDNFRDGKSLPWTTSFTLPGDGHAYVENGELCVEVTNKGANRWDAQLRHRDMVIQRGHTYSIRFTMRATQHTKVYAKLGQSGPPYREYWNQQIELEPSPKTIKGGFTMRFDDDNGPELAFHLGGNMALSAVVPFAVCLDDIHVEDPEFTPKQRVLASEIPNVLVNQTGYFPKLEKIATVRSPSPVKWELQNASNMVVSSGTTIAVGSDPASGDDVSIADFSSFTKPGTYTLKVGSDVSHPFSIGNEIYSKLKYQGLAYFYHNRSGIEIKMPFAGDEALTRPAGHVGEGKNKGDKKVPCVPGSGCTYSLDVTGGWYDAGDHGKYIVNAGISVWTLLDLWERAKHLGTSVAEFGDGKLNIPEKGNGVPDLLDEVRWELEFELKMQVPQGEKLAGMVHHKVHDKVWTALGLAPHEDPIDRFLYPPSTAATLNLAANAAQAARIWHDIDKAFAAKCLAAAERAWTAAQANPALYAKPGGVGGGPYDDDNVTDEFYWAAAELFLTTKKPVYREFITKSPFWKQVPVSSTANGADAGLPTPMTWGNVQSLGSISLAVVPGLPAGDQAAIRKNVAAAADAYLEIAAKQGYRVPFKPGPKGYPWGSNSFVLNNLIVMALAYDFTHQQKYLDGVAEGMDYIMGRNPMDQSYVTGYGARPLVNPHHRFWSYQANNEFPKAPAGLVSGGPNSGLEDPYVKAAGLKGCAPEKCFIDNIEAWSANEITINWNSPLVWVASFLDERAPKASGEAATTRTDGGSKPGKASKKKPSRSKTRS